MFRESDGQTVRPGIQLMNDRAVSVGIGPGTGLRVAWKRMAATDFEQVSDVILEKTGARHPRKPRPASRSALACHQ